MDDRRHTGPSLRSVNLVNWRTASLGVHLQPKRDDQITEESLELQCNLVITVGVIFKNGIDTTVLNIGGGQIRAGSQQR